LWDRIIDGLNNNHEIIHFFNRGTFFADFHRFILHNFDIRATTFVRLMEYLPFEYHPHVWIRASLGLRIIDIRLRGSELHPAYMNYVRELMSEVYGQRSYFDDDRAAINVINELSCLSGVQECIDNALNVLIEVMETGATDYEFDYQCNGLRSANETIWTNFYYRTVDTNSTNDRSTALTNLLCTENSNLLRFYLNQVLNTTNSLLTSERELILTAAAVQNDMSSYILMEVITNDFDAVNLITEVSNLIFELVTVTNNYIQAERVMSLVFLLPEGHEMTEEGIVELLQPNLDFIYRNLDELREWFDERTRRNT